MSVTEVPPIETEDVSSEYFRSPHTGLRTRVLRLRNPAGNAQVASMAGAGKDGRLVIQEMDYSESAAVMDPQWMTPHCRDTIYPDCSISKNYQPKWHGVLPGSGGPRERVEALLHEGLPGDVEKIRALAERVRRMLPPIGFGRRKAFHSDKDGDEIDVGRWIDGRQDFWIDYNRSGRKPSPYVSILGQFGGNCDLTPDQLFWRGAAAVAIVDALEDAGFRVQLTAAHGDQHGNGHIIGPDGKQRADVCNFGMMNMVRLKGYNEPLRFGPVSFALSHAGFFRTVTFGMIMRGPFTVGTGLGRSTVIKTEDVQHYTSDAAVLMGVGDGTEAGAVKLVTSAIEDLKKIFGLEEVCAT